MPAEILLPLRDRHHPCRTQVTTDNSPRSAFAIVFSHLRVSLRPGNGEGDPPKVERSPRRLLNALLPLSEGITHHWDSGLRMRMRRRAWPRGCSRSGCCASARTSCGRACRTCGRTTYRRGRSCRCRSRWRRWSNRWRRAWTRPRSTWRCCCRSRRRCSRWQCEGINLVIGPEIDTTTSGHTGVPLARAGHLLVRPSPVKMIAPLSPL
jgi:hypothetical protein